MAQYLDNTLKKIEQMPENTFDEIVEKPGKQFLLGIMDEVREFGSISY